MTTGIPGPTSGTATTDTTSLASKKRVASHRLLQHNSSACSSSSSPSNSPSSASASPSFPSKQLKNSQEPVAPTTLEQEPSLDEPSNAEDLVFWQSTQYDLRTAHTTLKSSTTSATGRSFGTSGNNQNKEISDFLVNLKSTQPPPKRSSPLTLLAPWEKYAASKTPHKPTMSTFLERTPASRSSRTAPLPHSSGKQRKSIQVRALTDLLLNVFVDSSNTNSVSNAHDDRAVTTYPGCISNERSTRKHPIRSHESSAVSSPLRSRTHSESAEGAAAEMDDYDEEYPVDPDLENIMSQLDHTITPPSPTPCSSSQHRSSPGFRRHQTHPPAVFNPATPRSNKVATPRDGKFGLQFATASSHEPMTAGMDQTPKRNPRSPRRVHTVASPDDFGFWDDPALEMIWSQYDAAPASAFHNHPTVTETHVPVARTYGHDYTDARAIASREPSPRLAHVAPLQLPRPSIPTTNLQEYKPQNPVYRPSPRRSHASTNSNDDDEYDLSPELEDAWAHYDFACGRQPWRF